VDAIQWLKENGADVNVADKEGRTPMHVTAAEGKMDAMAWLKENGADINARDSRQRTPLGLARPDQVDAEIRRWMQSNGVR